MLSFSTYHLYEALLSAMRYTNAAGNANAVRTARGQHPVVLDAPEDKGAPLKEAYPKLGWLDDIDGCPVLPLSIVLRLVVPALRVIDGRDLSFFTHTISIARLGAAWIALVAEITINSLKNEAELYEAFLGAGQTAADQDAFVVAPTEWDVVTGNITSHAEPLARWVTHLTRGDVFGSEGAVPSVAAAELYFYVTPFILTAQRDATSPFLTTCKLMGKVFQSDDDADICDGPTLAAEVATGLRDCRWPAIFITFPRGIDSGARAGGHAGARTASLRAAVSYRAAILAAAQSPAQYITQLLPHAVQCESWLPSIAIIFRGADSGSTILSGLITIAAALSVTQPSFIHDRAIWAIERLLTPLAPFLQQEAFTSLPAQKRLLSLTEKVASTHLASNPSATPSKPTDDGSTPPAATKVLVTTLTSADALFQLDRLAKYRLSDAFEPTQLLEMAHSGRMTPEMRAKAVAEAAALPSSAARDAAKREIVVDDGRAPLPPLLQLVCIVDEAGQLINKMRFQTLLYQNKTAFVEILVQKI